MFDKNLFDRNAYDRGVASEGVGGSIIANGLLNLRLTLSSPLVTLPMRGDSNLKSSMVMKTSTDIYISGEGVMGETFVILRQNITARLSGSSTMIMKPSVRTPIGSNIVGDSNVKSYEMARQQMSSRLTSMGTMDNQMLLKSPFIFLADGLGELKSHTILNLPLNIDMNGQGDADLKRISGLNESIFELKNINLQPGESVTIDTDILDVMFGHRHDVDSVTMDSVFFELNPGENEITISTDVTTSAMKVVAIWQNRWL